MAELEQQLKAEPAQHKSEQEKALELAKLEARLGIKNRPPKPLQPENEQQRPLRASFRRLRNSLEAPELAKPVRTTTSGFVQRGRRWFGAAIRRRDRCRQ
jgi:hypothetical protein